MARALAIISLLLLAATALAGKSPPRQKAPAASRCDKTYARPFTVTRGGGKVQLRVLKLPPPQTQAGRPSPSSGQVFEDATRVCRDLGAGWRLAVGSLGAAILTELKASDSSELKAALAACPVTFHRVDTVCAPCVAGSKQCPCADRDISDWIFCEKP
jgi:hypothetical protein